jgi:hypothetical protein
MSCIKQRIPYLGWQSGAVTSFVINLVPPIRIFLPNSCVSQKNLDKLDSLCILTVYQIRHEADKFKLKM